MVEINSNEGLMVWIMNRLSEIANEQAILKGGMVLRLLDCPRYTNDLDYVFVPFRSKKEIVPILENLSKELEGAQTNYNLHSTSLRFIIKYKNFSAQIEANASNECKTTSLST